MNERITREDIVEQSLQTFVRRALTAKGYPMGEIDIVTDWDYSLVGGLAKNTVALGVAFDDPGRAGEVGSDLRIRTYTFQAHTFGTSLTWAKNLGNAIKFAIERDSVIPLLDITNPALPQIDVLQVEGVSSERQHADQPEPWQRFIWATIATVEDAYNMQLV